jgi:hypothetical protein
MYQILASCSGTMVENSTTDPGIKGSIPAAFQHHETTAEKNYLNLISGSSTVVEHLTPDAEIKSLNPDAFQQHETTAKKNYLSF